MKMKEGLDVYQNGARRETNTFCFSSIVQNLLQTLGGILEHLNRDGTVS